MIDKFRKEDGVQYVSQLYSIFEEKKKKCHMHKLLVYTYTVHMMQITKNNCTSICVCDRTRTATRPWNTNADTTRLGKTWDAISGFQAVETQHSPMEWKVRCRACDPMSGGFLYCFWPWFDTVSIMQNAPGKKPALHWPSYAVNQWFLPFGFSNSPNSVATLKGFLRWGLRPGVWSRW